MYSVPPAHQSLFTQEKRVSANSNQVLGTQRCEGDMLTVVREFEGAQAFPWNMTKRKAKGETHEDRDRCCDRACHGDSSRHGKEEV